MQARIQAGPDPREDPGPAAGTPQDARRKDLIPGEQRELQRRTGEITAIAEITQIAELAALALQMDDPQAVEEVLQEARDLQRNLDSDPEDRRTEPRREKPEAKPDARNAILTIQAGAGGQDAQDWAERLAGMYAAWAAAHRRPAEWLSVQHGDRGGHRTATIRIGGPDAPGALRSEHGVHRLSHISPRDRNGRRHTSFASVEVIPEAVPEQPGRRDAEPNPKDLRTTTFRASGPGGQNVQKVSTAVRITHLPTGVTAACQSERSQVQNIAHAMTLLRSRLAARQAEEAAREKDALRGARQTASFGSRARSYVFLPSRLVRDHRTGHTHPNPDAVLAGDLDGFIQAYREQQAQQAQQTATGRGRRTRNQRREN
jgi:peptide chain release factor 2